MDSPSVSVVIPTFNRARLLGETLDRLAGLRPSIGAWDVVVADNNSSDDTRSVVESRTPRYPVPLRYVFEAAQGRSHALNAGIAATAAAALLFTDDDVIVSDTWIDAGAEPLLREGGPDYTGGPVHPIWESARPSWLSMRRHDLWGTIAILDYGAEPFVFEARRHVPLGANMGVRRSLVDRIGGFSGRLGRSGQKQLLGQEVPEFLARARGAGACGEYVPAMAVRHHVPARRLTKDYFRRWWYGKGLSRAQLDRMHPLTETGVDLSRARQIGGVPLWPLRAAGADAAGWLQAACAFDPEERFRHEAMLCYSLGYLAARVREARDARRRWTTRSVPINTR
jgi:glycosyltransferase involved in cell wall biosynthesis